MSTQQPSEEELRAAYESELKRITVADVVVQTAVSLVNLAGRRMGLAAGSEDERDLDQVRDAIDAVRALMPVLERHQAPELRPLRDALSQLQLAFARESAPTAAPDPVPGASGRSDETVPGSGPPSGAVPPSPAKPGPDEDRSGPGPGPAESSGRLWVPGR